MATLTFDTYQFIHHLTNSGMEEVQAKAIAEGLQKVDLNHVATRQDVDALKLQIQTIKIDILKWMIPMMLGQIGLTTLLIKLI